MLADRDGQCDAIRSRSMIYISLFLRRDHGSALPSPLLLWHRDMYGRMLESRFVYSTLEGSACPAAASSDAKTRYSRRSYEPT